MAPKPATSTGDAPGRCLRADEVARYHTDGLIVLPGFFAPEEVEPLRTALHADPSVGGGVFESMDTSGQGHDAISWIEKSDDLIGLFPFMARMADAAEALLGEECYHWHSKLTMKPPGAPARMEWHQDFGAWYDEGLLRPDLLTIGVAIDPTTRENGATQFLKGTHALGRIDHRYEGEGQSFVDDLDADSLALIELVEALEEELSDRTTGFRIEDEDLEDLKTVRDAVDYVHERAS